MVDSSGDDEDDILIIVSLFTLLLTLVHAGYLAVNREPSLFEQRLVWEGIIEKYADRTTFHRHLRMRPESFHKLLSLIRDDLEVDHNMALLRGGVILPELRLYCTIRWLSGGAHSDICMYVGISIASFYRVVWQTIHAIVDCAALKMKFPQSEEDCIIAAEGFSTISRGRAITNCVGVCDGFLMEIRTPPRAIVGNVRSYFSGHYQRNGVNCQAVSDHLSRFIYFAVSGPGVMGDNTAVRAFDLFDLIQNLPMPYCVIGDAAYQPTEHLVSMYYGNDRKKKEYDNFNFFASQLRIRVEMSFGLMTKKWGILWRPLNIHISNVKYLALAIAMMHNYCINERINAPAGGHPNPAVLANIRDRGQDNFVSEATAELEAASNSVNGWSVNREQMVIRIENLGLERIRLTRDDNNTQTIN
jgi:hypothetical protein